MGEIDFEMSSQAKCWMFNEGTLRDCRQDACNTNGVSSKAAGGKPRVRKFACGYHSRKATSTATPNNRDTPPTTAFSSKISPEDQETLIHFHAHQIQKLIGPNAIFPMLKRGASVLSTAIMLFRKFYLSNSVVDFHPRNIAAASALLAVKTDCERNLPVSQYFHQSVIILRFVSIFHDRIAIPFNLRRIAQRAIDLNFLADMRGLHSK
jgi:cyclin H